MAYLLIGLAPVSCVQSASIKVAVSRPPFSDGGRNCGKEGAVAQLGERLICIQEVAGSIPTSSTSDPNRACSSGG